MRTMRLLHLIPHGFTLLRLLLFPGFLAAWDQRSMLPTFGILLLIIGSDVLDGYFARKLKVASHLGGLFDAIADFGVIFGAFLLFNKQGLYETWVVVVIAVMFAQFLLTCARFARMIYDPLGKYFGRALFAGIGLTVMMPTHTVCTICSAFILFAALGSVSSRLLFLRRSIRP